MKNLNYLLKGFGFDNLQDFLTTNFKLFYIDNKAIVLFFTTALGIIRSIIQDSLGLDAVVFLAFVILIIAEVQTGIKVSMTVKGERIKSRKVGRMLVKIGVYSIILFVLFTFSSRMKAPTVFGLEVNPFEWLYYIVFTGIVFQLVVSWLENLGALGYAETKGVTGIILRKFNSWFEFDGTKNPDKGHE